MLDYITRHLFRHSDPYTAYNCLTCIFLVGAFVVIGGAIVTILGLAIAGAI